MTKMRVLLAVFIMVCGLLWGSVSVSAVEIRESRLVAGAATVRKGQEVEFVFSLDGYNDIKTGINAVKGTLEYDSDIFEEPAQENFEPLNSWESVYYNPENGRFVLIRRTGNQEGGALLRIKLTAKDNLPAKDTYVGVSRLSASEGKEDIFLVDAGIKLSAVSEQLPSGDAYVGVNGLSTSEGKEDFFPGDVEIKPNAVSEQFPAGSELDAEQGQTQQENEQEAAGEEPAEAENIFPGIAVFGTCAAAALLMIVILVVVRKKKARTGGMKIVTSVIIIAVMAAFAVGGVYAFGGKGDLNGDGTVDYADAHMLQKHLIALETLSENKWNRADMNSDGKLTVTDLSLLIQRIEKTLDYEVTITPAMGRFYYEKQEEVALKFYAEVSYGAEIERVTVNGTEYEAQRTEGSSEYTVRLKAADTPGVQEFHITKVSLSSGQEVDTDYTEKIDVLKTAPSVEGFLTEEITDTAQMKVSFVLEDKDSALTSSAMEVLRNADGEFTVVDIKEVSAGSNEFLLDLEEDAKYTLHISAQYNRDSNELEAEEDQRGSLAVMKEVQLNIEYQFYE